MQLLKQPGEQLSKQQQVISRRQFACLLGAGFAGLAATPLLGACSLSGSGQASGSAAAEARALEQAAQAAQLVAEPAQASAFLFDTWIEVRIYALAELGELEATEVVEASSAVTSESEAAGASSEATAASETTSSASRRRRRSSTAASEPEPDPAALRTEAQTLADEAIERCRYFEGIFSRTIATSDIGRINAAGGAPVTVAPETAALIQAGIAAGQRSHGLFDITIGAASSLWDFKEQRVPAAAELQEAVRHINYQQVIVEENTVILSDPAARLDLGGIAKGYIADDLAQTLRQQGCTAALINLGGDVYALGGKPTAEGSAAPSSQPFGIGLRNPFGSAGESFARVRASDCAVVTSGPYERGFVDPETQSAYHHILDPRTGYPVVGSLQSVSIIAPTALEGDICSTTCIAYGDERALNFLQQQNGVEGILMNDNGQILATPGAVYELL